MTKVSVIIPTYNRCAFLGRAVESVIDQHHSDTEIIIIDDRSTDNTESIVKSMQAEFPYIVYYRNNRPQGPSGARNTGILKSTGEYLAFLDSDDIWLKGHLTQGIEILKENPEIDVLFGNFRVVDSNTGEEQYEFFDQKETLHSLESVELSRKVRILQGNLFEALIQENFFHFGSAIVRKSTTNEVLLDESIMFAEDRDFAIRLYKEANATFAYREDPVFMLYKHDSNLIKHDDLKDTRKVIAAHLYLYRKYTKRYDLSNSENKILQRLTLNRLLKLSYIHRTLRDHYQALSCTLKSFRYGFSLSQVKELAKVLLSPAFHS